MLSIYVYQSQILRDVPQFPTNRSDQELLHAVTRSVSLTVSSDSGRFGNDAAVKLLPGEPSWERWNKSTRLKFKDGEMDLFFYVNENFCFLHFLFLFWEFQL